MIKHIHEIRDPIHVFIKLDSTERKVLDSRPFQRLRHIHQLAMTYLVYPGATHKRFEHSLGVMELASRVFDVITNPYNILSEIRDSLPEINNEKVKSYWRQVLRMAALCHDIGHLPFSHAAEKELLPGGWNHERFTRVLIQSPKMQTIWDSLTPPLRTEDIVKLAIGPKEAPDLNFTDWETILYEIIGGDAFGVDRIDYLLRDSYHTGVAYGKFDHHRLIDTLRILPASQAQDKEQSCEPTLGVEKGGVQSAEALLLARYFMFSQVYLHPVRRIYDILLKDFLCEWLENGKFSVDLESLLALTDSEIIAALRRLRDTPHKPGFEYANRIINRKHFKLLYERNPEDIAVNPDAAQAIYSAAVEKFGVDKVKLDSYRMKGGLPNFPTILPDKSVVSALDLSEILRQLPGAAIDFVFIQPEILKQAERWLKRNKNDIITLKKTGGTP
jgi:HD superfamily phosphohydrolase